MKYREVPDVDAGTVELAPGFALWREVSIEAEDYHGLDLVVQISWSDEEARLVVSRVDTRQRESGEPVTTERLRAIALRQFVRKSLVASVREGLTPQGGTDDVPRLAFGIIPTETAQACKERGPVGETLEWVAVIYRTAVATGDGPTKTIREVFGISQSTAGAWVAAARRELLLGASEGAGKAGERS